MDIIKCMSTDAYVSLYLKTKGNKLKANQNIYRERWKSGEK